MWLTTDKASPEGCGRGKVAINLQITVPEGLNTYMAEVQPLRGWILEGDSVDPVTAPLRGCLVTG